MKMSDLLFYLGEVPLPKRSAGAAKAMGVVTNLTAYHVTTKDNAANIRKTGIEARSSRQSYDRPAAVYLFLDREEITQENLDILGIAAPEILEIDIPFAKWNSQMLWDGLYNVFSTTRTAVQFLDNIPADWIR